MIYTTWYAFKKELERRLGYCLLNRRWLEVKPESPLPWDDSHLRAALLVRGGTKKRRSCRTGKTACN